jgi:hypothetical protein
MDQVEIKGEEILEYSSNEYILKLKDQHKVIKAVPPQIDEGKHLI